MHLTGLRVLTALSLLGAIPCGPGATARAESVYTVDVSPTTIDRAAAGPVAREPNHPSFDLAVIRFDDNGKLSQGGQLTAAEAAIAHARKNANGAIVVLFIHGWHHSAAWNPVTDEGDDHFKAFRQTLKFLTLREAERYLPPKPTSGGRRVLGVYVGWNGDPPNSWLANAGEPLTHLSFWNRYSTARDIGAGEDMRRMLRAIVSATKDPIPAEVGNPSTGIESPLILIGHSMGALMLQSAFLALLNDPTNPLVRPAAGQPRIVNVQRDGQRVAFPDVLIALNSAADSVIHREIRATLSKQKFTKTVGDRTVAYAGPLLISATSSADVDTKVVWRAANLLHPGRTTDGHDSSLFTHTFRSDRAPVECRRRNFVDFGQNWHCLRTPEPPAATTPRIAVDLPTRVRTSRDDVPQFARFVLEPVGVPPFPPQLTWVFQVPPTIVKDHNDIFNPTASSLMLALIQISGAIMSLAKDWPDTFEGPAR
jgi:hypothetical protein